MGRWSKRVGVHISRLARARRRTSLGRRRLRQRRFHRGADRTLRAAASVGASIRRRASSISRGRGPARSSRHFDIGDAQALPFADTASMPPRWRSPSLHARSAKAVAEMARVVKPGGLVATYMWDTLGGGLPLAPMRGRVQIHGKALCSLPAGRPRRRENMQAPVAGRRAAIGRDARDPHPGSFIQTSTISANSSLVPVGPSRPSPQRHVAREREQLQARLREQCCRIAADGSITYEAFANAVKGRVPT